MTLLLLRQGLGRALRHVVRFCCLFAVHTDAKDILPAEVTSLHQAFQDEMKILMPVNLSDNLCSTVPCL